MRRCSVLLAVLVAACAPASTSVTYSGPRARVPFDAAFALEDFAVAEVDKDFDVVGTRERIELGGGNSLERRDSTESLELPPARAVVRRRSTWHFVGQGSPKFSLRDVVERSMPAGREITWRWGEFFIGWEAVVFCTPLLLTTGDVAQATMTHFESRATTVFQGENTTRETTEPEIQIALTDNGLGKLRSWASRSSARELVVLVRGIVVGDFIVRDNIELPLIRISSLGPQTTAAELQSLADRLNALKSK